MDTRNSIRLGYASDDASDLQTLRSLVQQAISLGFGNYGYITAASTTNGQGSGGPTIIAALPLVSKQSGVFAWWCSGSQVAAAATEVVTWVVTTQTGTGAVATTGSTAAAGGSGPQVGTGTGASTGLFASAMAGTGIAITGGGGGELTQYSAATTIGTAAVGSAFATGGIVHNSIAATTRTRFTLGNNVILLLKITNSATNRVVTNMNIGFIELPLAPT